MDERTTIVSALSAEDFVTGEQLLERLAADLDLSTRVALRLRRDGLVEVVSAGTVVGFIDYVAPVFVALSGARPAVATEVAQHRSLARAVDALR